MVPRGDADGSCAVHGVLLSVRGRDAGGGEQGAGGDEADDGLDLGGEVAVGAGAGDAGRADGVADGAGRRRPARSGARRSRARAAVRISIASTRVSPSSARRSLRAACQPIETWSSCIAEDGIESTLAGTASRLSSLTIPAAVYWAIMWPESTPGVVGEERRQPVAAGGVEEPVGAPLAHAGDVGDRDGEEVEHVADRGAVEVAVGLDPAVEGDHRVVDGGGELAVGDGGGVGERCRGRRRAPAGRSAASRRPARGCTPGRGGWP